MFLVNILRDILGTSLDSYLKYYKKNKGIEKILTIGFDGYPFLEQLTGVGWYSYFLLRNLSQKNSLKINLYAKIFHLGKNDNFFVNFDEFKNLRIRRYGIEKNLLLGNIFWEKIGEQILTPLFITLDRNDFFFSPNYFPPPNFKISIPIISTIHDCTFKVYPEFLQKETLENLQRYLPEILFKAEKLISVSNHTKKDLIKFFNIRENKIKTVYNGFEVLPLHNKKLNLEPYLLFVSTIEPRKNLLNIIKAFNILREKGTNFNLVLIGKIGWKSEKIIKEIEQSPFKNFIHHLTYIKRDELGNFYKNAFCLLFPSFYEGFGLPILEAFSMGCPVITAENSSLKEIGGEACLYADNSAESIATAVIKIWEDKNLREKMIAKGFEISKNFSWEKTSEETFKLFNEMYL